MRTRTRIDSRRCVYNLQKDGSLVNGHRWPSILQSHDDNEPLAVLVSPEASMSHQRLPEAIPLEGKYDWTSRRDDRREYSNASLEVLSPQTLDQYKIPYYWDTPKLGVYYYKTHHLVILKADEIFVVLGRKRPHYCTISYRARSEDTL